MWRCRDLQNYARNIELTNGKIKKKQIQKNSYEQHIKWKILNIKQGVSKCKMLKAWSVFCRGNRERTKYSQVE